MQIFYRLFRNSQTQIRQRVNWRYWLIGCLLWAALLPNAQGEGSRDFTGYGGVRLFYSADVHQQLKVYANEGEFINFGTSHLGTTNPIDDRFKGLIYVYRPDGSLFQVYDGGNSNNPVGRIQNNTQESGGPTGGGSTNGTGYEPLVASVGSGESGIWTFVFKFEAPAMDQPFFPALDNGAAWNTNNQANNRRAILAWDITVSQNAAANAGGNQLTGRVYSNEYVSVTGNFGPQTSPTFYVLTRDGFQYQIDFDRADPFEFPVFSNSVGLIDGNLNPLNSSRIEPDVNRVSSLDNLVADQIYLYDPQERDVGAIITNKIFFSRPDPNMPNTATLVNVRETSPGILMAGAPFETWLFNAPGVDPGSIADLEFIGASELCTDNTTQVNAGGAFVFNSNRAGAAVLQLDTNNDGDFDDEVDVEIRDFIEAGRDTLFWDGTDGAGNLLTAVTGNLNFTVEIDLQRAEIHIMIDDVENIEGGIAFDLLNGPAAVDADLFFYDHRPAPRMNRIQNSAFFNVDLVSGLDGDGNLVPTDQSHNYADTDVDALQFERGFGDSLLLDYFNFIALAQPFSESLTIEIVENCGTPPDDFDEDGVPDVVDIDDDNDGILDRLEFCNPDGGFACLPGGVDPSGDEDNDGIQNFEDADDVAIGNACMDVNADGVCDNLPAVYDTDGDGVPDHRDVDSDNDGITDLCESGSEQTDVNGDGVIDGPNSDFGDNGFYVGIETDDTPTANPTYNRIDKDGDGVPDHDDLDTDNDGIYDLGEAAYFDLDANNDGRLDYESVNRWGLANVIDPDVTGNPVMKPIDFDNDGVEDFRDLDSDNDGINDVTEHVLILIQDPDGDGMIREGMPEVDENGVAIIDSLAGIILVISSDPIDFDNDGIPDFHDLDTDSDNILDAVEGFSGDFDPDFDGILGEGTPTVNEDGQVTSSGTTSTSDPNNQDGDELADFRDRDSDDDGIADINECVGTALCNDVDDDGTDDYREPNCTADNTPAITVVQNEMDVFCSDSTQLTYTITNSGFNAGIVTYTATLPNNTQITDTLVNNTAILTVANLDMVGGETMQVILTATENGCTTDPLDVLIDCEDFVCTPENSPTVFVSTNTNGTVCPGDDVVYTIQSTGFQEGEPDFFVTFPDGQEATGTLDGRESVITITATDTTFTGDGMFYLVGTNGCTSDTALVNIFVAKVNAVNDGFLATSGVPLLGADILQNDDSRDVDVTLVDLPNNGTASIDENGNLNYTSVEGYVGQDTLTYSICNMTCTTICDTAQVIIEVVPVDCDETNTPVLTVENTIAGPNCPDNTVDFTYSIANFVDGTILSLTNPAGELSNPDLDGMFTTEIGMGGTYTFIATNPNGCADTVMVAITAIETVTANDDSYSITNGETLTGVNVFDNDTNNGGTFTIVSDFENGTGAIDTDGNLTYTPNDGFVGMDTLTYEICDVECTAACDRATVIVTVDGCDETTTPVLTAMSSSTDPICPGDAFTLTWSTTNVIDGTTAILSGVGSIPLDGSLTLTLSNVSNYTFIATNPNGCADTVTVTLTVIETAIANDDNYTINTGETLTDVNIFDNDTNNGGTFTIVSDFENGTGSIDAEGNLTYMPNDGFVGMDTLTYEICDVECTESCDQAMVIVTVDGCDETTTPDLTITFVPDVTDPNAPVCPGTEVDYTFANTGGGEDIVITGTLPDGTTFEGTLADVGSYIVTSTGTATFIATAGECADTVTVTFNVIETAVANDDSYTISIGETLTG
ncbi:MAG: Ig-like domain-containing protein, partial [Saprospiraceae bacterium]